VNKKHFDISLLPFKKKGIKNIQPNPSWMKKIKKVLEYMKLILVSN